MGRDWPQRIFERGPIETVDEKFSPKISFSEHGANKHNVPSLLDKSSSIFFNLAISALRVLG